ncbi:MAG: FecR domain-containing protein [Deltaproteobacteria bacterium]|nr:FecR domain-containing protein [Deltaproteobacteria bacterium]
MSDDRQHDGEVRALRVLVEELREEAPPPLDWDRLEQRLLRQVDLERQARPRQPSHWGSLMAFAAAAAVVALLLTRLGAPPAEGARAASDHQTIVDLEQLHAEQAEDGSPSYPVKSLPPSALVTSGDEPLRFSLPGVATWVLEPHSQVVVQAATVPHVLTLERGAVHAEVVPRHDTDQLVETFAVEAGTTRVAVHGTSFSVERHDDHISVAVTHGTVAVGPTGHRGITSRHLLTSPARARFSLRGGMLFESAPLQDRPLVAHRSVTADPNRRATASQPPAAVGLLGATEGRETSAAEPVGTGPTTSPGAVSGPDTPSDEGAPEVPAPDPPALDRHTAQGLVVGCVRGASEGAAASKTRMTISSQVTVTAGDDGTVVAVRFAPPLRPDLQQRCGAVLFGRRIADGPSLSFPIDVAAR